MASLRIVWLISMIGCFGGLDATAQNIRIKQNINRDWAFTLGDIKGAEIEAFDDAGWANVSLPHSFSIPYFMWGKVYQGYGWYRKVIDVPDIWNGKNVTLEFEGAFIETEAYVNGKYLGKHVGGYTGFVFDLTAHLVTGKNVVAVRINNLWNPRVAPRAGDHQFSGGIYRDVYLNVTDKLHVDWCGTFIYTPRASKTSAACEAAIEVRNNYNADRPCTVKTDILSPEGKVVASGQSTGTVRKNGTEIFRQVFPAIAGPQLWSPESPKLYSAVTTVSVNGSPVDQYETTFGIRHFEWTADRGFFLNGEHYYLLGANVHQDQAGWGDAVTNAAMRRDVQMIKDAGFNCIRGSHYPHDPAFSQACDEIGIILFQENAFWGMGGSSGDKGWGTPSSGCYPPKAEDQSFFDQSVLAQLGEMIKIHRNHASIAAWSMSNEPFFTDAPTDGPMKRLLNVATDSARSWDPTREVAIGGAQRKGVDRLGKGAIAFYNGDGASREEFQNPGVPNLVSEYGSTTSHRPGRFFAGWGDVKDGWNRPEWRSGYVIWCGFDHGTVGGVGLATMGLIDYFRLPKRQYYWYAEAYGKGIRNPVEPQWPQDGTPAKLRLEAGNYTIAATDGTDDVQVVVTVLDASGTHVSRNIPVELSVVSGPGEFPTGRNIRFAPPSNREESDIAIRDGRAAIAFRSYYAGKTIIRATAEGVEPAIVEIVTHGTPVWQEGVTKAVEDRPYKRYVEQTEKVSVTQEMLLAANRPAWASSELKGTNKANANDGHGATVWKPAGKDKELWWKVALEASYCIDRIQLEFPEEAPYQYLIEVSGDDVNWTTVADRSAVAINARVRTESGNLGCGIAFVRIRFVSEQAGLSEIKIGGVPTSENNGN
ncbi:MAG: glycoside hydrolase family 2 TIM barrel-domain containing protein [Breznakibacter sp.]